MSEKPTTRKHDWPALLEEWRSSGLTKADFCRNKGLAVSGMYSALSATKKKPTPTFAKVMVKNKSALMDCVIELPNQVRIRLTNPSADFLLALMK